MVGKLYSQDGAVAKQVWRWKGISGQCNPCSGPLMVEVRAMPDDTLVGVVACEYCGREVQRRRVRAGTTDPDGLRSRLQDLISTKHYW